MNIFEFADRFNVSLAKVRKMHKAGLLRIDESTREETASIRLHLARGQSLTAAMLCDLLEDPAIMLDLGGYASRAEKEIAALGKVREEAAPKIVAAFITDAAKNDEEAVNVLSGWLRTVIPAKPVGHAYIAVRLLLGLATNIREYDVPRIPRALLNCRQRPEFAAWWRTEKRGKRNVTIYCRPKLDALDL